MVRFLLTPASAIAPSTVNAPLLIGLNESPGKTNVFGNPGGQGDGTDVAPEHRSAPVWLTFQVVRKSNAFSPPRMKS